MATPEVYDTRTTQWQRIRGKLRAEFGDGVFRSWLKPMMRLGRILSLEQQLGTT